MLLPTWLTNLHHFLTQTLGIYYFSDYVEIIIFSFISYRCLMWLKQDHTKNLLLGSYAYMSLLLAAHLCSCTILFQALLFAAPLCILLVMITHQKQLQKNFLLAAKAPITFATNVPTNWLEILIQSCLTATHHKKNIVCIIERSQHLLPLLKVTSILHVPVQQQNLALFMHSSKLHNPSLFWLHESGIIQGVNVGWADAIMQECLTTSHDAAQTVYDAAPLFVQKTDALIFSMYTSADTHTIWHQDSCIKHATTTQLIKYLTTVLATKSSINTSIPVRNNHVQSNTPAS